MISTRNGTLQRDALGDEYRRYRQRSAELFALVDPAAFENRPIPLRHPFIFYEGHLPAFAFLTVCVRALGEPSIDGALQRVFERGIDPSAVETADALQFRWPSREVVRAFAMQCEARVREAIAHAEPGATDASLFGQAVHTVLEHELMHHETLLYIVHQLDEGSKRRIRQEYADHRPPANDLCAVAAGRATLGASRGSVPFGWDNEFPETPVNVAAFAVQRYPVTNADWMRFVAAGGPRPGFWRERDGTWRLRGVFEEFPLPQSWPVYVTQAQATAYASWSGMRLPTEAEYHRAAFGSASGDEREMPWGNEPPDRSRGNFGSYRYDPEPVDGHPSGQSAWGVHDIVGNGWEWTGSAFGPLPGFEPMATYPQYSADFFDGRHFVLKGASPATAPRLVRRAFRNWFYDDYPYVHAKFRCAVDR